MQTKKVLSFAVATLVTIFLTACSQPPASNIAANETYNMSSALDAHGYCLFMNKQIEAILNQLSTQMTLAKQVADGEYPADRALASSEASLKIIEDAETEVEIMLPPDEYKDNHDNTLHVIQITKDDVENMIQVLSGNSGTLNDLENLADLIQGDFAALTAEFNIYYK